MKQIHCPNCQRFLCKASFADIEMKCGKCKRIVRIRFYSQSALILTPESKADSIEIEKDQ